MTPIDEVCREILKEGLEDWVPIDRLIGYAQLKDPDGFPTLVREVLTYLFSEGLAEAGRFGDDGYAPEGSSLQLLDAVIADCEAQRWAPHGGGYWLSNTEAGDRAASAF